MGYMGEILLQFAKELKVDLAVHAELLTIQEGLLVAVASRWASSCIFVLWIWFIVGGFTWFSNLVSTPCRFHNTLGECQKVYGVEIKWLLTHIKRTINELADVLARMGDVGFNCIEFVWVVYLFQDSWCCACLCIRSVSSS